MEQGKLNKYFDSEEFVCKCGCGIFNLDPDFFDKLTEARRIANVPFIINSGCRCPEWNRKKGGSRTSGHITTDVIKARASDIESRTVDEVIAILRGAILVGISGIALGVGFVHLDSKQRRMIKSNAAFTLTRRGLTLG